MILSKKVPEYMRGLTEDVHRAERWTDLTRVTYAWSRHGWKRNIPEKENDCQNLPVCPDAKIPP
jgi:hypothetical protein